MTGTAHCFDAAGPHASAEPLRAARFAPGDLIGFSGCDLASVLVNLATIGIPWYSLSHVGIIAQHPQQPQRLLLWESTGLMRRPCLLQRRIVYGVQAHPIRQRIQHYRGRVWHYPLSPFYAAVAEHSRHYLANWLERQQGTGYDAIGAFRTRETPLGWIERRLSPENLHLLFCSELVVAAWRTIGVWNPPNASAWNPNRLARTAWDIGIVEKRRRLK